MEGMEQLRAYLLANFPGDVLMPVLKGAKHPMFKHKNGEWSWDAFDRHVGSLSLMTKRGRKEAAKKYDVCVVLSELCVVDVDDEAIAERLEARFPVLRLVPCERTRKGRHYWFKRSDAADELGYFDGAGQREHGIDFKSVCSNGTGGIVLVAPSTDKTWIRAPWTSAPIDDIPFELLDAVAVPKLLMTQAGAAVQQQEGEEQKELLAPDAQLIFLEEGAAAEPAVPAAPHAKWLARMSYFEPFFVTSSWTARIPVPCSRADFERLVRSLDTRVLQPECEGMVALADKLGLHPFCMRTLQTGELRQQMDVALAMPRMWQARYRELMWLHEQRQGQEVLDDTNDILVEWTKGKKMPAAAPRVQRDGDAWLFHKLMAPAAAASSPSADDDEDDENELPNVVDVLLRRHAGHLVLAGGAVTGLLCPAAAPGSDYDLFVVGLRQEEATAMLQSISEWLQNLCTRVHQTDNALTFVVDVGGSRPRVVVQIVLRLYQAPAQVLASFDIAPCKAMAYYNAADVAVLQYRVMPTWVEAVASMAFPVEFGCWGKASVARVLKYHVKGFDAFVPTLRRAAISEAAVKVGGEAAHRGTLAHLLRVETQVYRARARAFPFQKKKQAARLTEREYRQAVHKLHQSDYDVLAKLQGRLAFILDAFLSRWMPRLPSAFPSRQRDRRQRFTVPDLDIDLSGVRWRHFNVRDRAAGMGVVDTSSPKVGACFVLGAWRRALELCPSSD